MQVNCYSCGLLVIPVSQLAETVLKIWLYLKLPKFKLVFIRQENTVGLGTLVLISRAIYEQALT
jgi:hypothetical protein